jgi:c-di-GMP-binding flagellar brake protein YcgR
VVDDFLIQYTYKVDAQHLMAAALKQDYEVTIDWEAKLYSGITFDWDFENRMVVYQCQDTSKQPSISSNTQHPRNTLDER